MMSTGEIWIFLWVLWYIQREACMQPTASGHSSDLKTNEIKDILEPKFENPGTTFLWLLLF